MAVWRIWSIRDGDDILGYVWFQEITSPYCLNGLYRLTAVFDEFQGRGAATSAAEETEKILIAVGVKKYYAQVNGCQPATGLRGRE